MLANGMTTFGETDGNARSECHPWSATPVYELLTTVAGIQPGEAGFKTVRIAPALGSLRHVEATMPHPLGPIEVSLERSGASGLKGSIRLPQGLSGEFVLARKEDRAGRTHCRDRREVRPGLPVTNSAPGLALLRAPGF